MPRCPIQADRAAALAVMLLVACGDAAVPQGAFDAAPRDAAIVDTTPPIVDSGHTSDACSCSVTGLESRIDFVPFARELFDEAGAGSGCAAQSPDGGIFPNGELMGGSAALEDGPNEYKAWLFWTGPWWHSIFPRDSGDVMPFLPWYGSWRAPQRDEDHRIITTAACLMPAEDGAECVSSAWVSHAVQTATVAPPGSIDLRASCGDGVLIAGGCTPNSFPDDDIAITRAGFAPNNRDEWLCSFSNLHESIAYDVMSLAFCLHEEPLPAECGCCPSLADSLTVKQEIEPLRFGANRLQVQCDPGQLLVLGNCMIDTPSAADVASVKMFRSGFPPTPDHPDGDRSTWGCSWYNPTGNTPQAIATAVCLPVQ